MTGLTPRQEQVLAFVLEHTLEKLYQPTIRDIADHFNIASLNAVFDHLRALAKKGYLEPLEERAYKSRALRITNKALLLVKPNERFRVFPTIKEKEECDEKVVSRGAPRTVEPTRTSGGGDRPGGAR